MENSEDIRRDRLLERAVDALLRGPAPAELSPERVEQLITVVRCTADQPAKGFARRLRQVVRGRVRPEGARTREVPASWTGRRTTLCLASLAALLLVGIAMAFLR